MPPIYTNSSSCTTLVDAAGGDDTDHSKYMPLVIGDASSVTYLDDFTSIEDQLEPTKLLLPQLLDSNSEIDTEAETDSDDNNSLHSSTFATAAQSTNFKDDEEKEVEEESSYLYLPSNSCTLPIDKYIADHPIYFSQAQSYYSSENITKNLSSITEQSNSSRIDSSTTPFIYVHQREVAHVSSTQYNGNGAVLASDSATTCHVFCLRSTSTKRPSASNKTEDEVILGSLCHLDSANNEECIQSIVAQHVSHHAGNIDAMMDIHIVGGFQDDRDQSADITSHFVRLMAKLAERHEGAMRMRLATCIVTQLNDDQYMGCNTDQSTCPMGSMSVESRPIAGGLSLHVKTGHVQLLKCVDNALRGPDATLRRVRLWSSSPDVKDIAMIHGCDEKDGRLVISPFDFAPFPDLEVFETLPDELILEYTSTSPHCEPGDFCMLTRECCKFIRNIRSSDVFGEGVDEHIFHRWSKGFWDMPSKRREGS